MNYRNLGFELYKQAIIDAYMHFRGKLFEIYNLYHYSHTEYLLENNSFGFRPKRNTPALSQVLGDMSSSSKRKKKENWEHSLFLS